MPKKTAKTKVYRRTKPNIKRKTRTAKTLTVRETARYTGIGISAIYQLIRDGELPSFDVGGRKRYVLRTAVDRWLDERSNSAA
jgi:excisionase family DNA binding protein